MHIYSINAYICHVNLKKIISILFVILIIVELCGVFFLFKVQQQIIKYSVFHQIKMKNIQKDVSVIRLSNDEFKKLKWTEEEKEFEYHCILYDIVSIERVNDFVIIYCINDIKENQLISNFYHWMKDKDNPYDIPFKELAKFFQINFFMQDNLIYQYKAFYSMSKKSIMNVRLIKLQFVHSIKHPPKLWIV